jgi:hypothetical protein
MCQWCIVTAGREHYLYKGIVSKDPFFEDEVPKRGYDNGASEAIETEFPSLFPLTCACIHARHEEYDIERGERVENLAAIR